MDFTKIYWFLVYAFDIVLYVVSAVTVVYILIFSIASLFKKHFDVPKAKRQNRFAIIIPSYRGDEHIESTVKTILAQNYPQRLFDITVVSDHMSEMTNIKLAQYPITLLVPNFKYSTKAKSMQFAMANLPEFKIYDAVIVLAHNSLVESDFLERVNDAYEAAGTKALQVHRVSRNRNDSISNLGAIFEEINNSIFRQGHINLGLSAALCNTGMVFDFNWFDENVKKLKTAWDNKELEALLLKEKIHIDYFNDVYVYDEKTHDLKDFNKQRGKSMDTQYYTFFKNLKHLIPALLSRRWDFAEKIFQWLLLPKLPLMAIIAFMSIILPFIYLTLAIKWWVLGAVVLFAFALAVPDYLVDEKWDKSFAMAPVVMVLSALNIFKPNIGKKKYVNVNKENNIYK